MTEKYEEILRMFLDKDRQWMAEPFLVGNKVCSTNGVCFVAVPFFESPYTDKSAKTIGVYPVKTNGVLQTVDLLFLKEKLALFPTEDDYDETIIECEACDSTGEVEWEFSTQRKNYYLDDDCPVCNGRGGSIQKSSKPNGKKRFVAEYFLQMSVGHFSPSVIVSLIAVMERLGATSLSILRHESEYKPLYLSILEVEMIVMPVRTNSESKIIR